MTAPAVLLSLFIALGCGMAFHLIRGGDIGRLGLYLITSVIAFFAGHLVAEWLGLHIMRIGTINLFAALLSTLLGLVVATILAGSTPAPRHPDGSSE
jgi:hypothetical protein